MHSQFVMYEEEFQHISAVCERLTREANAKFLFDLPDEIPRRNPHVVDRACVLDLGAGMDAASREKLEQLFHLDEWFERRWRMRTGTLYVAGP